MEWREVETSASRSLRSSGIREVVNQAFRGLVFVGPSPAGPNKIMRRYIRVNKKKSDTY